MDPFNAVPSSSTMDNTQQVRQIWASLGLPGIIDVHTHFMPKQVMDKVWQYFDANGPLIGRDWPIAYRTDEAQRVNTLRRFGVRWFTSLVYPHKPQMAEWLNQWAAQFAVDHAGLPVHRDVLPGARCRRLRRRRDRRWGQSLQGAHPGRRLRPERSAARRGVGRARGRGHTRGHSLRIRTGTGHPHRSRADPRAARADTRDSPW